MQLGTALIAADPSISSWRNVPNPNQQALRKAVDDKLRQEEIPPVNVKVIDWRMAQVIKDTLKKNIRNQPACMLRFLLLRHYMTSNRLHSITYIPGGGRIKP